MTTRISNNSPSIQNAPSLSSADPTVPTATTTPATPPKTQPQTTDFWESDDSCPPLVPDNSIPHSQSTPESKAQEFSVKDALLTGSAAAASTTDATKLAEMPLVKDLLNAMNDSNKTASLIQKSSTGPLADALENPDALRSLLANAPGGSPKLADEIISDMKKTFVGHVGSLMYSLVKTEAQNAQKMIAPLVKDTIARREFLTTITSESKGDPQFIQASLQALGYAPKDAAKLASTLAPMHEGPIDAKTMDKADRQLRKLATDLDKQLGNLSGRMVSNAINNNRFLTDPTFDAVRNSLLTRLNAVCEPPEQANGLGKIINEATAKSKSDDFKENVAIGILLTTATIASGGIATAGMGVIGSTTVGLGVSTLANAPELIETLSTPERLRVAANAGLSAQENADNAIGDRNANLGKMLAFTVMGAGASIASQAAGYVTDVGLQAGSLGYQYMNIN